ncbi:putative uncharacterized protein DDB_G0290521 [Lingula anatina]|uniref:Sushi domain-containing protein n=1 Tax=Lingula anatina TaxID=7574 RepID=A0A1S3H9E9_LINAN|nr:putative uncharacterized protein DDB_G0290521 [Lingula anatina]|eukprot:XP_013382096.1 putative uncharacterized protein DDB_G0290521 [Lingula anatina]
MDQNGNGEWEWTEPVTEPIQYSDWELGDPEPDGTLCAHLDCEEDDLCLWEAVGCDESDARPLCRAAEHLHQGMRLSSFTYTGSETTVTSPTISMGEPLHVMASLTEMTFSYMPSASKITSESNLDSAANILSVVVSTSVPADSPTDGLEFISPQSTITSPMQLAIASQTQSAIASPSQSAIATPTQSAITSPRQSAIASLTQLAIATPTQSPIASPTQSAITSSTQSAIASQTQSAIASPTQSAITSAQSAIALLTQSAITSSTQSAITLSTQLDIALQTQSAIASSTQSAIPSPTQSAMASPTQSALPTQSAIAEPTHSVYSEGDLQFATVSKVSMTTSQLHLQCPPLPPMPNTNVIYSVDGTVATVECSEGYRLNTRQDNITLVCLESLAWNLTANISCESE